MEPKKMKLFVDNKSTIDMENHPVCHSRIKHIKMRYDFMRDQVSKGKVELEHCKT